jgi:hypothetical protein
MVVNSSSTSDKSRGGVVVATEAAIELDDIAFAWLTWVNWPVVARDMDDGGKRCFYELEKW